MIDIYFPEKKIQDLSTIFFNKTWEVRVYVTKIKGEMKDLKKSNPGKRKVAHFMMTPFWWVSPRKLSPKECTMRQTGLEAPNLAWDMFLLSHYSTICRCKSCYQRCLELFL
jgi:hypothetical protein